MNEINTYNCTCTEGFYGENCAYEQCESGFVAQCWACQDATSEDNCQSIGYIEDCNQDTPVCDHRIDVDGIVNKGCRDVSQCTAPMGQQACNDAGDCTTCLQANCTEQCESGFVSQCWACQDATSEAECQRNGYIEDCNQENPVCDERNDAGGTVNKGCRDVSQCTAPMGEQTCTDTGDCITCLQANCTDPCAPAPCLNGATCVANGQSAQDPKYQCICQDGFYGQDCGFEVCDQDQVPYCWACQAFTSPDNCNATGYWEDCTMDEPVCEVVTKVENGIEVMMSGCKQRDVCNAPANQELCDDADVCTKCQPTTCVDPCADDPCNHGATCQKQDQSYECICPDGFYGKHCDFEECLVNELAACWACQDYASVQDCMDSTGYWERCNMDNPVCEITTKEEQGVLLMKSGCVPSTECTSPRGTEQCDDAGNVCTTCNATTCTDPCSPDPCENGGTCNKAATGTDFTCACPDGFVGETCQQELVPNPCTGSESPYCTACDFSVSINECSAMEYQELCFQTDPICRVEQVFRVASGVLVNILKECASQTECVEECVEEAGGIRRCTNCTQLQCLEAQNACDSFPCYNGATCDQDGTGYICTCRQGFQGDQCETVRRNRLYGYGEAAGDTVATFQNYDDGSTTAVWIEHGIKLGCELFYDMYINVNGYVSFGSRFEQAAPQPFTDLQATVIAPFWTDMDASYFQGSLKDNTRHNEQNFSRIYYHQYSRPVTDTDIPLEELFVFASAEQDVTEYAGDSGFRPDHMLIVTWENMIQYPITSTTKQQQPATFQLVLMQNTYNSRTYAMLSYESNSMDRTVVSRVGYTFQPKPYTLTNTYSGISVAYDMHKIPGDTNADGKWLYRTSDQECEAPNALYKCLEWDQKQKSVSLTNLDPCPCSQYQARFDPFYQYKEEENCAYTIFSYPNGQQCCYDDTGDLITEESLQAGTALQYTPTAAALANLHSWNDMMPKTWCCIQEDLCDIYFSHRPIDTCQNYQRASLAWAYGDPHLMTLDGLSYDYNGVGEYWLLKASALQLQARLVQAWSAPNTPVAASVFGAFAGKEGTSPAVHVQMNDDRTGLIVRSGLDNLTPWFNDAAAITILTVGNQGNQVTLQKRGGGKLIVSFNSGIAVQLEVRALQLDLITMLSGSADVAGVEGGLLGNLNKIPGDDLKPQGGGTLVPSNSTAQIIHQQFAETWRLNNNEGESLFWYPAGRTSADFNDVAFTPVYDLSAFTAAERQQALTLCNGNKGCQYDLLLTNNQELGQAALEIDTANEVEKEIIDNNLPRIQGAQAIKVTVGKTFTMTLTVSDLDGDPVTTSARGLPAGATFDPNTLIFTWMPQDRANVTQLTFVASDGKNKGNSKLSVAVFLCDCTNQGSCDWTRSQPGYKYTNRFRLARCKCQDYWTGPHCAADVDGCLHSPCPDTAICTDLPADQHELFNRPYNCTGCPDGYELNNGKCIDIDECAESLDSCNDTCTNTAGSFVCSCPQGYKLQADKATCQDLDECALGLHDCTHICSNVAGGFTCSCYDRYTSNGGDCQLTDPGVLDDCSALSCEHCRSGVGGTAECFCPSGYELYDVTKCQDIDECVSNTANTCSQLCHNTLGGYNCSCQDGYTLDTTDRRTCKACESGRWGAGCENYCRCASDEGGVCDRANGCTKCPQGWQGANCDEDINECLNVTICGRNAKCSNSRGTYLCNCYPGSERKGEECLPIDDCATGRCDLTQGICEDQYKSYKCVCNPGYTGIYCREGLDECSGKPCKNGGVCIDGDNGFTCDCIAPYYGALCDQVSNEVTTPVPLLLLNAEVRLLEPQWTDDLLIVGSQPYTDLVFSLENIMELFFNSSFPGEYIDTKHFAFRQGSIISSFVVYLRADFALSDQEVAEMFIDWYLAANLTTDIVIDTDNVFFNSSGPSPVPPTAGTPLPIVGIITGTVMAMILVIILVVISVYCCNRQAEDEAAAKQHYRNGERYGNGRTLPASTLDSQSIGYDDEDEEEYSSGTFASFRYPRLGWSPWYQPRPSIGQPTLPNVRHYTPSPPDMTPDMTPGHSPPTARQVAAAVEGQPGIDWSILRNFNSRFGVAFPGGQNKPPDNNGGAGFHRATPPYRRKGDFYWMPTDQGGSMGRAEATWLPTQREQYDLDNDEGPIEVGDDPVFNWALSSPSPEELMDEQRERRRRYSRDSDI